MFNGLLYETRDAVARVTLNNPDKRNALSPPVVNELLHALERAKADPDVRVVVLTGAGRAFCAGGDLGGGAGPASTLPIKGDFADLLLAFAALGKPTIARVNGAAMGGGLGLVAACDVAIAAESAELGTPEIRVGLWPMQIMVVLARLVPRRRLVEMMLTGDKLSARAALEAGILTRVVPDGELDAAVDALAAKLAASSGSTMRIGLEAFHRYVGAPLEESLPRLRERFMELVATDDAREGIMARLEKRAPRWTGR